MAAKPDFAADRNHGNFAVESFLQQFIPVDINLMDLEPMRGENGLCLITQMTAVASVESCGELLHGIKGG